MSDVKLSIIIPCYNATKFIETCIQSIYNQNISESDYEVICIDDNSSDNTINLINDLREKYSSLKLIIHDSNKKQGAARNTGLEIASGEYVWFIDSDDYIRENVFSEILFEVRTFDLDILIFNYVKYSSKDNNTRSSIDILKCSDYQLSQNVFKGVEVFAVYEYWEITSLCWNRIIKRSILSDYNILFYDEFYFEDVIFGIKCFLNSNRVKYTLSVNYFYRDTPNSVMNNTRSGVFVASFIKLALEYKLLSMEILDKELSKLFNDASRHNLNSIQRKVLYLTYKERIVFNNLINNLEKITLLSSCSESLLTSLILFSYHFRSILYVVSPLIRFLRFVKRRMLK